MLKNCSNRAIDFKMYRHKHKFTYDKANVRLVGDAKNVCIVTIPQKKCPKQTLAVGRIFFFWAIKINAALILDHAKILVLPIRC